MFIEIVLFLVILCLLVVALNKKPDGLPPGEWGWPIVGYLPFMKWKVTKTLKILQEKHGPIFTIKLGSVIFVVICDYSLMKVALSKHEFSGRPSLHTFNLPRKYERRGIIISEKEIWTTNRRFAIKTLKDFGFGKSRLEEFIHTEVENLVKDLKKEVNKPSKIDWNLNVAILNIIWRLMADRRFDISDNEIKEFTSMVNDNLRDANGPLVLLNIFPYLKKFLPTFLKNVWMKENRIKNRREVLFRYFLKIINEHKKSVDAKTPRDYIDAYLTEKEIQKENLEYSHFGDEDLLVELMDIFLAGSDTTASTLRWFFLYMAKSPQVQRRVQEEIDRVLPRDKFPTMLDKDNLPCLEALTYEITRKISLSPISIPHGVTEDTMLGWFLIPKGAVVIPYTEYCHSDPRYWKHPNEFSLSNFLDDEGKFVPPKEGFVPFCTGRRQCVGEQLAKTELFLFIGAILQNFAILEPQEQTISLEPIESVFMFNHPQDFKIIIQNRQ